MVLTITDKDLMRMQGVLLDKDRNEALEIIRELVKQIELQNAKGMKSHLNGG